MAVRVHVEKRKKGGTRVKKLDTCHWIRTVLRGALSSSMEKSLVTSNFAESSKRVYKREEDVSFLSVCIFDDFSQQVARGLLVNSLMVESEISYLCDLPEKSGGQQ